MKKPELVFIPAPGIGHLVSMVEFAKRLLDRDGRPSVTVLFIRAPLPPEVQAYAESIQASDARIRYIILPPADPPPVELLKCVEKYVCVLIESYKSHVKDAIVKQVLSCSRILAGIVVDFFCTSMIDVANELNVPSYLFFTSNAAFLGFMSHFPTRHKRVGEVFNLSGPDSIIPTYANPVPSSVLPSCIFNADGYSSYISFSSRFKATKGFIINTFAELEPYAINALACDKETPPVYTVGPLLDLKNGNKGSISESEKIMKWLDEQPAKSVVFLCFGSTGGFDPPQMVQMAIALERSGYRFLWSIRQPKAKTTADYTNGYSNLGEIFPEGFSERTKNRGMLCCWAPQVDVLAHEAVGGFVSHCGWNSTLESLWYGVPMVTWPIYAEQQLNAFEMVKELGLAVELKLDYRVGSKEVVCADEIERALRSVMDKKDPVRKRVEEMKEKSRKAVGDGGSSFATMGCFIDNIMGSKLKCFS